MQSLFLDTIALAKRYIYEPGSAWISQIFSDDEISSIYIAELTTVELTAAIIRRSRGGSMSSEEAAKTLENFDRHLLSDYFVLEINSETLLEARALINTHGLRGYDAVQLAIAEGFNRSQTEIGLTDVTFVSADSELLKAAQADGLKTENPNNYE